jgi:hypothetical protein
MNSKTDQETLLEAVRAAVNVAGGVWISRRRFLETSGLKMSDILRHYPRWTDALVAAGFSLSPPNERIDPKELLADWGLIVRNHRTIPTRNQYKIEGDYSVTVFDRNFGPWSTVPSRFREFAKDSSEWADVVALLPVETEQIRPTETTPSDRPAPPVSRHPKLAGRPTYGDPIDFRGLRHVPVNEDGVIFLFGMVARELGYLVEAVQVGFPDCEAKRQIATGQWQWVRIEFEFESRNFRDHGHPSEGCDIIVCWKHNWPDCPASLEVVELSSIISQLAKAAD